MKKIYLVGCFGFLLKFKIKLIKYSVWIIILNFQNVVQILEEFHSVSEL